MPVRLEHSDNGNRHFRVIGMEPRTGRKVTFGQSAGRNWAELLRWGVNESVHIQSNPAYGDKANAKDLSRIGEKPNLRSVDNQALTDELFGKK